MARRNSLQHSTTPLKVASSSNILNMFKFFTNSFVKQGSHLAVLEPRVVASWLDLMASSFIFKTYFLISRNRVLDNQELPLLYNVKLFLDIKKYVLMIKRLAIRSSQLTTTRGSNSAKWEPCLTRGEHSHYKLALNSS